MMVPTTLMIDRRYRGVGRIHRASGTKIPAVKRKIERMLEALHGDGRLDILRALRDGSLSFLQVLDAYQRKTLAQLPVGPTVAPLHASMEAWVDSLVIPRDASADHVRTMRTTLAYLEAAAPSAAIADAPAVLERLRDTIGKDRPRSFNLARSHVMAFVRATLKRSHPVWLQVSAVEMRKVPKSEKRRPLTIEQFRNWFPTPESSDLDAIAWALVTTGMGAKEYFGKWGVFADRVLIFGTKREGRQRSVPLIWIPFVATCHRRTFENKFRDRTSAFTPYDLRRTYANWMEAAGIPRTRRRLYLGHGIGDVTDLYEQHEVTAFLAEDAERLRVYLGLPPISATRLRAEK